MRPIDKLKAGALILLAVASVASITTVAAEDAAQTELFSAPNSQASVKYKYFDEGKSFIYCFNAFDLAANESKKEQFCTRSNKGTDYMFMDTDKNIKLSNDMTVVIRYNTLDQGLIDKTYKVAPGANGDKSVFIVNPEDRLDISNMLLKSKDVILFYKANDSDQYELMYYPMPKRETDGKMPMVEAR